MSIKLKIQEAIHLLEEKNREYKMAYVDNGSTREEAMLLNKLADIAGVKVIYYSGRDMLAIKKVMKDFSLDRVISTKQLNYCFNPISHLDAEEVEEGNRYIEEVMMVGNVT